MFIILTVLPFVVPANAFSYHYSMFIIIGIQFIPLLNDKLDTSEPVLYDSKIKKKDGVFRKKALIRSKKHKLIIEPWGQYKGRNAQIIKISEQLYKTKKDGYIVQIEYHKGKFNIPWFIIIK